MFALSGQRRFYVALLLSLLVHAVLLFAVAVKPGGQAVPAGPTGPRKLEVTLQKAPPRPAPVVVPPVSPQLEAVPAPDTLPTQPAPVPPEPAKPVPTPAQSAKPVQPEQPAQAVSAQGSSTGLPAVNVPLIQDPVFYPAKQVDVHPAALGPIMPVYPDDAAEHDVTGKVLLLLLIDETGMVVDVSVVNATPPGYFEESAVAAFKNARFSPAEKAGRKVRSRVLIQVSFELNGPPAVGHP